MTPVRHSPTLLVIRDNTKLVYGLGLAALANSLGFKIDEPSYKAAGFMMRGMGIVPWDLPKEEVVLRKCETSEQAELVRYYYSKEAMDAVAEARSIKEQYFRQFPSIEQFLKNCTARAASRGWVKTWTGRRRHFKDKKNEAYKAPNALIQGGCGDITKTKMYETHLLLKPYRSRQINNIHDALLFEIHKEEMFLIPLIYEMMKDIDFSVPMGCSVETSSTSWADMKEDHEICKK